jgi:serine/threonine protein kinase
MCAASPATALSSSSGGLQVKDLGAGSFARVEECVLRGQSVAVKRLRPELFKDLEEIKGFVTEGITLAKLRHPCVPDPSLRRTSASSPPFSLGRQLQ